ncbi:MAG: hypothetical protein NTW05_09375 [Pseudonocardiales bacterium]|nr:hypothetical protein [Pseudonocardiales bacterium]
MRAVADQLAAEAAAALLALAARADAADPVMQERRAAQQRRAERLRAQLDRPRPARGSRDARR